MPASCESPCIQQCMFACLAWAHAILVAVLPALRACLFVLRLADQHCLSNNSISCNLNKSAAQSVFNHCMHKRIKQSCSKKLGHLSAKIVLASGRQQVNLLSQIPVQQMAAILMPRRACISVSSPACVCTPLVHCTKCHAGMTHRKPCAGRAQQAHAVRQLF